jgi:hypothetical protein
MDTNKILVTVCIVGFVIICLTEFRQAVGCAASWWTRIVSEVYLLILLAPAAHRHEFCFHKIYFVRNGRGGGGAEHAEIIRLL